MDSENESLDRRAVLKGMGSVGIMGLSVGINQFGSSRGGNSNSSNSYPIAPVTFIVPFGPGGGTDRSVRQIQPYFENHLDSLIRPQYKPGAGTQIGQQAVLNAAPDATTIGIASIPAFNFTILVGGANYKPTDFAWIGTLLRDPGLIRKHKKDNRFNNIQDVFKFAKKNPRELSVSTSGPYNQNVLGLVLLQKITGAEFNIVPYDSGGAARSALVKREVDLVHANVFNSLSTSDSTEVLAVHAMKNEWKKLTNNAPTFSDALEFKQSKVPPSAPEVLYAWYTQSVASTEYPDRFKTLQTAFRNAINDKDYIRSLKQKSPSIASQIYYLDTNNTRKMVNRRQKYIKQYVKLMEEGVKS